uniref:Uncharacterized protein n=1 Tax=Ananas comosus var. bracteatus TaxID=296719 RepID=A0A6V7NQH4_ANACO|nr:unnamed protein product [Ananas comosus var. bracteatus]
MSASDAEKRAEEGDSDGGGGGGGGEGGGGAVGGELLYCGGTSWETMGRKVVGGATGNLVAPRGSGPSSASTCASSPPDALLVTVWRWMLKVAAILGEEMSLPTIVSQLSKYKIVKASVGKNHTVVVTEDGKSFSFGMNKHGQLGTGSVKNEIEPSPLPCLVSEVTNAVCGADFTVWLSSVEGSSILTAGLPQYGQLGHGTDNEYNAKDSSVKLAYEPQPRHEQLLHFRKKLLSKLLVEQTTQLLLIQMVCLHVSVYHLVSFLWGFGGYGRLGHREQKDEWVPRLVEVFQRHNVLPPNAVVSAGATNSACTGGGGQLYMWGK